MIIEEVWIWLIDRRTFYRLCRGTISPSEHDVRSVPWLDNIRARSFSYNLHMVGKYRVKDERRREPNALDIGIAEWTLPYGSMDLTVKRNEHFTLKTVLRNPNQGVRYRFVVSIASHQAHWRTAISIRGLEAS